MWRQYISLIVCENHFKNRLNRLCELPRGFGSFPSLQILDLTYNNLTSASFSANFAYLGGERGGGGGGREGRREWYTCTRVIGCLKALFLGDNDLNRFPPNMEKFIHLEVVGSINIIVIQLVLIPIIVQLILRDNDIADVPATIHGCVKLSTLQLQGNQINVIPPEMGTTTTLCELYMYIPFPSPFSSVKLCDR